MSSCGWLGTMGDDQVAKLVNPLSREIINLPNIDKFFGLLEWKNDIRKLVFLPQSSLVVIISGFLATLKFCRIGDDRWTSVDYCSQAHIYDITYYSGRVYSFDHDYYIKVCDVFGEYPKTMVTLSKLSDYLYDNRIPGAHILGAYILGLDDDDGRRRLLVVIREGRNFKKGCSTKCFKIFEFDLEDEKWSKVKDLGRKTLFVGYNSSFWIEDTTGVIKGNCIYYTGHIFDLDFYRHERDMGIYHLSDGTIEPHFIGESRSILTPLIWLQSNTHY